MSLLVSGEILGLFPTVTSNGKYRVEECENLQLPNQTQLSEKRKHVAKVFVPFLDSTSNFEHFERKGDRHS